MGEASHPMGAPRPEYRSSSNEKNSSLFQHDNLYSDEFEWNYDGKSELNSSSIIQS